MDFLSLPVFYYDALSSQARSCLMLIKLLNIDVELRPIDSMNNMNFDETYLWINSFCMFPTLRDGNITLCNGSQILIYLSQKYCVASDLRKLCPSDYISRLKIMNMLMYEGFILQRLNQLLTDIFLANYPNFNVDYHKNKVWHIYNCLNIYLKGHNFMLGNRLTITDIAFVSSVSALNVIFPIDYEMYPRLFYWLQRLKKMHFYTNNEEGLLKLRYFLDKVAKFPIPSPFSYQAENAETSSNDKETKFSHQFNMNGNKNNKFKQSKKLSLDSKTDQIESVAEVSGFAYNKRNMEVNSEPEILNVYNTDVTNTCRCSNGLCNFHSTNIREDTFSRNLNQFLEANEIYRRRANSNSNHYKMYGCCHLPYRNELEFDWSCPTTRNANDSWQFEMPQKETKSCVYVQYYNVSPYNKESNSPSSSRGTELYGGVKPTKCFCCCHRKSRPPISKCLIKTKNSNQGKRLYPENSERGINTKEKGFDVYSWESDEYDGSKASSNETLTNHYSQDTGPVIPTHDKKNQNNKKSETLIERKEIQSGIFKNDDHSGFSSRESKIDQTFLKHYNPVIKSDITLNDKHKNNSDNSDYIIIENEKNYTKESPEHSDESQSDIYKNDKAVIKSDITLNDEQNNNSEDTEIITMGNEINYTKESPEHLEKSQSDISKNDNTVIKSDITLNDKQNNDSENTEIIAMGNEINYTNKSPDYLEKSRSDTSKNDKTVIKSDIILNANQNNDSENSEITTMESATNYTNESPKYSNKSQSDLFRIDKPVVNTEVALNDKPNNDSENSEIIPIENETNYTKESPEHSDESQSDIYKNDKPVIKSDITLNDEQNNNSEDTEIITMGNEINYTKESPEHLEKSQSDIPKNDKTVIKSDITLNDKQNNDSENTEIIAMGNEINYTNKSPDYLEKSRSDTSKNDKTVIKSDITLNDEQNKNSEDTEIITMGNEINYTKESPEHLEKSQSDISKNDNTVIKSDITLNDKHKNNSDNSDYIIIENEKNYTKESPEHSDESQSDIYKNDKAVIKSDITLNDEQNNNSEDTEIITMGNEINYTKESPEHLEKRQSDISKNDKTVIKSDITLNDNQNNDSKNSEITTMENATNSQSDLSKNDKPAIESDKTPNDKQNNDSENSEITTKENELNFTKESPEHSDESQSNISKNYKQSDFKNREVQNLLYKILHLETIIENLSQISNKTSVNKISPSNSIGLTDGSKNNSIYATAISYNPELNCECKCNKQNGEHTKRDRSCQISSKELLSIESCLKPNSNQINLEKITPQYLLLRNSSQQSPNQSNQIKCQKESTTNISESDSVMRICCCNKNVLNDDCLEGGGNPKS